MNKENTYTYTTSDCTDNKYNYTVDISNTSTTASSVNDYYGDNWCHYLLPCGICEKTGRACPKHNTIRWDKWTCNAPVTTATNKLEYTTDSTYSKSVDKYNTDLKK